MTEFIMFVGLPASGKSTYAGKLKEQGYHIHSSDVIREELTGDVNAQDKNTDVFTVLHKRVKDDLGNGISCVYDATNMSMKRRKAFLNEIKKYNCRKICVLFVVPVEICNERNSNRERRVPNEVFDKMLKSFWVPMEYEGWDEIEVESIDAPYPFDYESMKGFSQDNPHHHLDLLNHNIDAEIYAYTHEFNFRVRCAAKYHDCGKLYTKTFIDSKGNKTDIAHFYGHEHYGAYIFLVNSLCGCGDVSDSYVRNAIYIAGLINWHMRPHTGWEQSDKARERDRKLIGEEVYQDIMCLHEADLAAH